MSLILRWHRRLFGWTKAIFVHGEKEMSYQEENCAIFYKQYVQFVFLPLASTFFVMQEKLFARHFLNVCFCF